MAKLTGKVKEIYPTNELPTKKGGTFKRRDLVIMMQSFDRETGEPTIDPDNTPVLTLSGDRCALLDNIAVGQIISVDYYISGRRYIDKEGKEKLMTSINVTNIKAISAAPTVVKVQPKQEPAAPVTEQAKVPEGENQEGPIDDLPF